MKKIALEIEAAAAEKKLSMNHLCAQAGISRSTFTRWKSGQTKGARLTNYQKLKDLIDNSPSVGGE